LCVCKAFGGKFIAGAFLKLIQDIILFAGPILLEYTTILLIFYQK
jgi:hypothetical protein